MQLIQDQGYLTDAQLTGFVHQALQDQDLDGKRVLFVIPDQTRSMPMATMFRALYDAVHPRALSMDFLIALGTHPPMTEPMINKLLGVTEAERQERFADIGVFNHEWQNLDALAHIGTVTEEEIAEISGGLMREKADVLINKRVLAYDVLCVVGPVFPHEVVGYSGGNKYFFPGVAGAEILNLFHWLGALITNPMINGAKDTPVRAVIDKAASLIPKEKICFCLNVTGKNCKGIFFGSPQDAWSRAADLAAQTHVIYKDKPFKSVLAMAPPMYDELWVAGKCMYKLEPVVADGGELIIYAPHLDEISVTHGDYIHKVGYHTRDYFLSQMENFKDIPGGILAHSTHVRGIGTCVDGVEKPRIDVTLATGLTKEQCDEICLGYRDVNSINVEDWRGREDDGLLLVENAGETLYRLKENNPRPQDFK